MIDSLAANDTSTCILNVLNRLIPVVYSSPKSSLNCFSERLPFVVAALPDGRRLQPGWLRQSEGNHANQRRRSC